VFKRYVEVLIRPVSLCPT